MINSVRNTVLSIIDKDNSGFISPLEFNLYAKSAQLEIFQEYFDNFRKAVLDKNNRRGSKGATDEVKDIRHKLDIFTKKENLTRVGVTNRYTLPSDLYMVNNVLSNTDIVEEVDKTEFYFLGQANLASPSDTYKIFTRFGNEIEVSPALTATQTLSMVYYRTPSEPKWTYIATAGGDPIYNASATDHQDFELHPEEETQLIVKILRYAGVSIRAEDVVTTANTQDKTEFEKENLT
tara:strand:+ start:974 stop:1678 length:705 start_codon:yes stop_codon:yes gene_type:complete